MDSALWHTNVALYVYWVIYPVTTRTSRRVDSANDDENYNKLAGGRKQMSRPAFKEFIPRPR